MPRALLVARHFPPIGGAGVHRTVGSVRHLASRGYDVTLVTGSGHQRGRWDFTDPGLLDAVPKGAEIHRVIGPEPSSPPSMLARIEHLAQRPSEWVRWWVEQAVELGARVGADADVVIASCAPYETAWAGARLAERLGVPWVADLEDPWALDEMRLHPTGLHHRLDVRRMRRALRSAAAIIMAAPEAAARVRATMPELVDRVVTGIPIGFEPSDFAGITPEASDGVFRIVHTGSMHTDFGMRLRATRGRRRLLGGTFPGVDFLTRSHVFLVEAIAALLEAQPELSGRVELHLAGDITHGDRAVAAGHDFVRIRGLMPHRETVALMRSADLLFLPMQDLPPGVRAGLIPYKTYEYLAAGRPIVAAVPDGDVRDMLGPLPHATVVRPADVPAMTAVLCERIAAGRQPDVGAPRTYERAECVAQIAEVLDQVTGMQPRAVTLAA